MDIKDAAFYLLILRIISSVALLWVISKQITLLRENHPPEEQRIRFALLGLTGVLLCGNFIPILVDVLTLVSDIKRTNSRLNLIGIAYTFNNAGFAAIAGLAWASFYILAERLQVYLKKENRDLHQEVEDLHYEAKDIKQKQDKKDADFSRKNNKKA